MFSPPTKDYRDRGVLNIDFSSVLYGYSLAEARIMTCPFMGKKVWMDETKRKHKQKKKKNIH